MEIDHGLIRASLINILENAIEACIEDKSESAHWITFEVHGERDEVIFSIIDNGIGMGADQIQNIFKLFWSSKGKRGTGLGLFITNKVIQKHGGSIEVSSKPSVRTVFDVRLPRKMAESVPKPASPEADSC
jgi:signal transduction histidine kinase